MSSGDGKPKESELRTTIFKRELDTHYSLRVSYSRKLLADIDERFPTFPFTLRALDAKTARIGIADMVKHDLVHPYPVLHEKEGEFVARLKFTALLMPSGTTRITGLPVAMDKVQVPPDCKLTDESLVKLLSEAVKKKKKGKKAGGAGAAAPPGGAKPPADNKQAAPAAPAAAASAAGAPAASPAKK